MSKLSELFRIPQRLKRVRGEIRETHQNVVTLLDEVRRMAGAIATRASGGDFSSTGNPIHDMRIQVANTYLRGTGIEIGALNLPLPLPKGVTVKYVDRMSEQDLRRHYPEYKDIKVVDPDIIDDGETLGRVPKESQDFVIANHFIEHCQDPIATLLNFLRVLKHGGFIYMAVPDRRYTFDNKRPLTTLEHLILDHEQGPSGSRRAHFREWVELVDDRFTDKPLEERVDAIMAMDYSIHFHVWDTTSLMAFLSGVRERYAMSISFEMIQRNGNENLVIIQKV